MATIHPPGGRCRIQDLTAKPFGRLKVIAYAGRNSAGKNTWRCLCECGTEIVSVRSNLMNGHTVSCGCAKGRKPRHGQARSPEYRSWSMMRNRCSNSRTPGYENYGGRGITVCERWKSFENFFADMGLRPTPSHTIERINNDGPYSPENCRWATRAEQNNNSRNCHWITRNGQTLTITQWSRIVGISSKIIYQRLGRGWTEEEALTIPLRRW